MAVALAKNLLNESKALRFRPDEALDSIRNGSELVPGVRQTVGKALGGATFASFVAPGPCWQDSLPPSAELILIELRVGESIG